MTRPRTFDQHWLGALVAWALIDGELALLGLGVPLLCILAAPAVGWFNAWRARMFSPGRGPTWRRILRYSLACAAVTFGLMLACWLPLAPMALRHPHGLPLRYFPFQPMEHRPDQLRWLAAMVFGGPLVQLALMLAGAAISLRVAPPADLDDPLAGLRASLERRRAAGLGRLAHRLLARHIPPPRPG